MGIGRTEQRRGGGEASREGREPTDDGVTGALAHLVQQQFASGERSGVRLQDAHEPSHLLKGRVEGKVNLFQHQALRTSRNWDAFGGPFGGPSGGQLGGPFSGTHGVTDAAQNRERMEVTS